MKKRISKKRIKKKKSAKPNSNKKYVTLSNKWYGKTLKGIKIHFEGSKPKGLGKDGSFKFGKHTLETLISKFGIDNFKLILNKEVNSIEHRYGKMWVKISSNLLDKMDKEERAQNRDVKNTIVRSHFGEAYPKYFKNVVKQPYVPGTLERILNKDIISELTKDDREAVNLFIPEFISEESLKTLSLIKAKSEIKSLKTFVKNFEKEIYKKHAEHWWQEYIQNSILLIQQGYIKSLEKLNVAIGNMKFPDFALISHDGYLDILEIKRPDTKLLKEDAKRNNFYFDTELSKAIIQTENYMDLVSKHRDPLRSHIKDNHEIVVFTKYLPCLSVPA
jgi:hypothetical protein